MGFVPVGRPLGTSKMNCLLQTRQPHLLVVVLVKLTFQSLSHSSLQILGIAFHSPHLLLLNKGKSFSSTGFSAGFTSNIEGGVSHHLISTCWNHNFQWMGNHLGCELPWLGKFPKRRECWPLLKSPEQHSLLPHLLPLLQYLAMSAGKHGEVSCHLILRDWMSGSCILGHDASTVSPSCAPLLWSSSSSCAFCNGKLKHLNEKLCSFFQQRFSSVDLAALTVVVVFFIASLLCQAQSASMSQQPSWNLKRVLIWLHASESSCTLCEMVQWTVLASIANCLFKQDSWVKNSHFDCSDNTVQHDTLDPCNHCWWHGF